MLTQQLGRRNMVKILVLFGVNALLFLAVPNLRASEDYPNKPISVIVGYGPGGTGGIVSTIFAETAAKYLPKPQPVLVVYKPGATTVIAADYVKKQPPDGYTIFSFGNDLLVKMAKEARSISVKREDFIQIGTHGFSPYVMVVNKESPYKTLEGFIDYAKKHPGELSYANLGTASMAHLTAEVFMAKAGIKLKSVPFDGGAKAGAAVLGGHVDSFFGSLTTLGSSIKEGGGLRTLAVFDQKRLPEFPDVPTIQERGYNTGDSQVWLGIAVAKGTPQSIVDILAKVYKKTAEDPQAKAALLRVGFLPLNLGPQEANKKVNEEYDRYQDVLKGLDLLEK